MLVDLLAYASDSVFDPLQIDGLSFGDELAACHQLRCDRGDVEFLRDKRPPVDILLKESLFASSVWQSDPPISVLDPLDPLAYVLTAIGPFHLSEAFSVIVSEFALVDAS
jgi:hypothetical protein